MERSGAAYSIKATRAANHHGEHTQTPTPRRQASTDPLYRNLSAEQTGMVTGPSADYPAADIRTELPPGMDVAIARDYNRGGYADPTSMRMEGAARLPEENEWGHTHLVGMSYQNPQRAGRAGALYGVNAKTGAKSLYAD